jgi:hypothetical protein
MESFFADLREQFGNRQFLDLLLLCCAAGSDCACRITRLIADTNCDGSGEYSSTIARTSGCAIN